MKNLYLKYPAIFLSLGILVFALLFPMVEGFSNTSSTEDAAVAQAKKAARKEARAATKEARAATKAAKGASANNSSSATTLNAVLSL